MQIERVKPPIVTDVARAVRMGIARAGLKQVDVSVRTGIPRATICTIARGKANPTMAIIQRIATAVGMKVSDMLKMGED